MRARKKLVMAVKTKEKLNALEALEEIDKRLNLDPVLRNQCDLALVDGKNAFSRTLYSKKGSITVEHLRAILSGFVCSSSSPFAWFVLMFLPHF